MHHARGENVITPRRLIELKKQGELVEFITHFPEHKPLLNDIDARWSRVVNNIQMDWDKITEELRSIREATRKDFALRASKSFCPAALFALQDNRYSDPSSFLIDQRAETILRLLYSDD